MGEGNVFSLFTSGGVPISHNALQNYPECHGAGGVPCQVQPGGVPCGGYPAGGYPGQGGLPCPGGTLAGGVPWPGGYPGRGGTPPGQGGTQLGQHKEYLLHGRRYAACVHAGGLSCSIINSEDINFSHRSKFVVQKVALHIEKRNSRLIRFIY